MTIERIIKLIQQDDVEKLEAECKQDATIFAYVARDGSNLSHVAAFAGSLNALEWLEKKGVDSHAKDKLGRSPAHYAAENGKVNTLAHLVKKDNQGDLLNQVDHYFRTPLMHAARKGHLSVVEYLLTFEAVKAAVDQKDDYNRTALIHAAKFDFEAVVDCLIGSGANPLEQEKTGWTAFVYAAEKGQLHTVQWFLHKTQESKQLPQLTSALQVIQNKKQAFYNNWTSQRSEFVEYKNEHDELIKFLYYEIRRQQPNATDLPLALEESIALDEIKKGKVKIYSTQLQQLAPTFPAPAIAALISEYTENHCELYFNEEERQNIALYLRAFKELNQLHLADLSIPFFPVDKLKQGRIPSKVDVLEVQHFTFQVQNALLQRQANELINEQLRLKNSDAVMNCCTQDDAIILKPLRSSDEEVRTQLYLVELAEIDKLKQKGQLIRLPANPLNKGAIPKDSDLLEIQVIKLQAQKTLLQGEVNELKYQTIRLKHAAEGPDVSPKDSSPTIHYKSPTSF